MNCAFSPLSKVCSNQLRYAVIMSVENAAQGHTTVEEEKEAVMKNLHSSGLGSSSGSYHSPEDEFAHLLPKRENWKVSANRDPDYILEQQEVW
jgi:hypothetical protein